MSPRMIKSPTGGPQRRSPHDQDFGLKPKRDYAHSIKVLRWSSPAYRSPLGLDEQVMDPGDSRSFGVIFFISNKSSHTLITFHNSLTTLSVSQTRGDLRSA